MQVLIDECLPRQLKEWISGFVTASTVQDNGWANLKNGVLLRAANDAGFDVLLTGENINYQQNLNGMRISVLVLPTNRKRLIQKCVSAIEQSLSKIQAQQKVVMDMGPETSAWASMRLHAVEDGNHFTTHHFKTPGPGF